MMMILRRYVYAVDTYRAVRARERGLTVTDLTALSRIVTDEVVIPRDLGDSLHLTTASVTALVDRLERKRLVRRRPNPGDRRSVFLVPTAAAHALLSELKLCVLEDVGSACRDVAADEVDAAMKVLSRVTDGVEAKGVIKRAPRLLNERRGIRKARAAAPTT